MYKTLKEITPTYNNVIPPPIVIQHFYLTVLPHCESQSRIKTINSTS